MKMFADLNALVKTRLKKCGLYLRDLGGNRGCFQRYSKVATIIVITDTIPTLLRVWLIL